MEVRRATPGDAAELARLSGQLGYPSTPEEVASRLARVLGDPEHAVFVAAEGERLLGFGHVRRNDSVESPAAAELVALVVDEARRGEGIGQTLVFEAEAWTRSRGLSRMRVRSNVVRERAHRFYERLGYRIAKTQHAFDKELR